MKRAKLIFVLWMLVLTAPVKAQEMWGAAHSNYAGQMGIDLNPASIVDAPYKWELHFLSMDVGFVNNYMLLQRNSRLIRNSFQGETTEKEKFTDRYRKTPNKAGYLSAFAKYPAFIWSDQKWGAAFHVSTRAELSANKIPYHLAKYLKEGFDYDLQQDNRYTVKDAKAAMAAWHEFGLTFGKLLYESKTDYWSAAATVNYNYGLDGFFLQIDDADYIVPADTLLIVNNINATYGHAFPDNSANSVDGPLANRGNGFSTTVGVQYFKNRNYAFFDPCKRGRGEKPYDYRIGFSLMDIGYIRFNKGARTYRFENNSTDWYGIDTTSFNGFMYTDSILSSNFYGNRTGSRDQFGFTVFTPAAASLQFDYAFSENLFVNATIIQRIPLGPISIRRTNQIAITPRFESRRFEFSIPFSYYEFFRPRLGVALRYGIFTIGSDMLSPLLGFTDSYGADVFFGITWKNYGKCGRRNKGSGGVRSIEKCLDGNK